MKLTSKGKKILATTAIVLTMMTSSVILTGCMSEEQKTVAAQTIEINNKKYMVGDLYLLTNKKNPKINHVCLKEVIGTYEDFNGKFTSTKDFEMYYDVTDSEIIAVNTRTGYDDVEFNSEMTAKYSYEELKRITQLGTPAGNNYKVKPYYDVIIENIDKKIETDNYSEPLIRK